MVSLVPVYCSAKRDPTLALMPPVPTPTKTMASASPPTAIGYTLVTKREDKASSVKPTMSTMQEYMMVLSLPRYWSAMTAPKMGVR